MSDTKTVALKIRRQANPGASPHWEEFELQWHPGMNVISSLMEIAANPVTRDGRKTTPVTYDSNCLEEVCGSCAMLINGRAHEACVVIELGADFHAAAAGNAAGERVRRLLLFHGHARAGAEVVAAIDRHPGFDGLQVLEQHTAVDRQIADYGKL